MKISESLEESTKRKAVIKAEGSHQSGKQSLKRIAVIKAEGSHQSGKAESNPSQCDLA
jgi:hypothetical protein